MLLDSEILTQIAPLELKARTVVEGFISGLHRSPYHGFSVEFAGHRPYNPGDDFKHIDWKAYGKTGRFYVKQYEEETNLRARIVLDISSSMYFSHFSSWSKLRYAIHYAASLMYMMHRQRDACGLVTFDEKIRSLLPAKSSYTHLRYLFHQLESILAQEEAESAQKRRSASASALHDLAERLNQRSLIVILSDLFENVENHDALISALKHLRHRNHEVLLFNILEQKSERELDFPSGNFRFEDMETGEKLEVIPSQIRESYQKKVREHTHRLKLACSESKIDFQEIDTQAPFDLALLSYLKKRKRLG